MFSNYLYYPIEMTGIARMCIRQLPSSRFATPKALRTTTHDAPTSSFGMVRMPTIKCQNTTSDLIHYTHWTSICANIRDSQLAITDAR